MNEYNLQAGKVERVTFGMGCFWSPDSLFGAQPGVVSTLVGYTGGTTPTPTYRKMGDHTETIQVSYDPEIMRYEDLLRLFWQSHDATKDRSYKERQYISLLVCTDEAQLERAKKVKAEEEIRQGKPIETELQVGTPFYPAEERHQKYYLRRFEKATEMVQALFPDEASFQRATIAARLNGFVREKTQLNAIKEEVKTWGLSEDALAEIQATLGDLKW